MQATSNEKKEEQESESEPVISFLYSVDRAPAEGSGGIHEGAVLWKTPHTQTSMVSS